MRFVSKAVYGTVLSIAAAGLAPAQSGLDPNAGTVTGMGMLNDHDGNRGTWSLEANLAGGNFSGTMSMTLAGQTMTVSLVAGKAYYENGTCVFAGEQGRSRFMLRGKCDKTSLGPGLTNGYFDGGRSFNGEMTGNLQWAAKTTVRAVVAAEAGSALPSTKLFCVYRERIGGVLAGDLPTYETRSSPMVTLMLSPDGTYKTANSSGSYTRQADTIRFSNGAYAGAVGRLRADRAGEPAVYFELEENRSASGVPIVGPYTTACVKRR